MAYMNMKRNRAATLVAVGALHVGVIYALVAGLAGPVWKIIETQPFVGDQIPLPKPPPAAIETPAADPVRQHETTARDQTRTEVPVVDTTNFRADDGEIILPPIGGGTVEPPPPPLPPAQTFTPKRAQPMGKPSLWVTPNDYPAAELRAGHEGVTGFELSIGADGKIQSCRVTTSSGFPALDAAACTNLRKRGKFAAATDSTGAAAASSYSSAVHWTIPKDY